MKRVFLISLLAAAAVCQAQTNATQAQPEALAPADSLAASPPAPASVAQSLFSPATFGATMAASISDQLRHFPARWGSGVTGGWPKRAGSEYAQVAMGHLIQSGVQRLHHEDPRYFRRGQGNFFGRTFHVFEETFVVHNTNGGRTVSWALPLEAYGSWGIASLWYPRADRSAGSFFVFGTSNIAIKAAGNFVHEFWPDVKAYFHSK